MSKKKNKINKFSKLVYILFFLLFTFFIGCIISLKILPFKYLIILLIVYILLVILLGIPLLIKKSKKIISTIICICMIVISGYGLYYLDETVDFINTIDAKEYQIEEYYVLVLESSGYESLTQITNLQIGVYSTSDNYVNAVDKLDEKIDFQKQTYNNYVDAANALLNKKEEAILINSIHKSILDEQIKDFNEKVKCLDTISIRIKNDVSIDNVNVTDESFNIYISGIDIYGDISLVSRSDVNMVATVNPVTHEILLTSIPRDYYVKLHGTMGYRDKLTHAGLYGINTSVTTIEDLLNIDIDYYVRVNFTTLINLVDSIGGIDIYSDKTFTAHTNHSCKYIKGNNTVNGKCALAFARERYAYLEGDRHRIQNQQNVLTAILNKTLSSSTLITKYTDILKSLGTSFQTNIPSENIYELINMQIDKMPKWNITTISLNGSDSYNYTYSYSAEKLYVMEPNQDTINNAIIKIKEIEGNK